ncbi:MAG: hypothetical protein LBF13_01350 [Campylobacteraceae bacterium]|jgi:hypothetical protein|nr:hypothetical protein [Campylobacteraceae bacterium]
MRDKIFLNEVDCTNNIQSIRKLENGKYEVIFKRNEKIYTYNFNKVAIGKTIDNGKYVVQINGKIVNNIKEIIKFDNFYQLTLENGNIKCAPIEDTNLISSCLENEKSAKKFNYFKEIASEVGIRTEEGTNILSSHYNKIQFIRNDTILANYFNGEIENNYQSNTAQNIFPFGFNPSQKIAVENAMNHKISIIQ